MAKAAWYPKARKLDYGTTGGTMIGGPPRAVLHTTETQGWAGARYYHIEMLQTSNGVEIRQYRPFNKASLALRNLSGGVQTNRMGEACINVCVTGYAKDAPSGGVWTLEMYKALHELALWLKEEWNIPLQNTAKVGRGICYGYHSICRMSSPQWQLYTGWCGHQNVPENTHWDPGAVDWDLLLGGDGLPELPEEEDDMFTKLREQGPKVEYWQRRILRIDANALPQWGADGDYGDETAQAVAALVPGSDGKQIGPLEAEALDALVMTPALDLSPYAKRWWVRNNYVAKGAQTVELS